MFSPDDRLIFSYRVGSQERRADPDPLYRRLVKHHGGLDLQTAYAHALGQRHADERDQTPLTMEEQETALEALLSLAEVTFAVQRFERDPVYGLTEGELLDLLASFLRFVSQKKSPDANSPSSAPGGGALAATPPTASSSPSASTNTSSRGKRPSPSRKA